MKPKITDEENYTLLEDILEDIDITSIKEIRKFMKDNIKKFKKLSNMDKSIRCRCQFDKQIKENIKIRCNIFNCEDIDNFGIYNLQITFELLNSSGRVIFSIVGSEELKGCNLQEIKELYNIIQCIINNRSLSLMK